MLHGGQAEGNSKCGCTVGSLGVLQHKLPHFYWHLALKRSSSGIMILCVKVHMLPGFEEDGGGCACSLAFPTMFGRMEALAPQGRQTAPHYKLSDDRWIFAFVPGKLKLFEEKLENRLVF